MLFDCSSGLPNTPQHLVNATIRILANVMFPESNITPPHSTQISVDPSVTVLVPGDLPTPVLRICRWYWNSAFPAAVPKTTVNKYRQSLAREIDIGSTRQLSVKTIVS